MGIIASPSEKRYRQILKRQSPPRWGAEYLPAIFATRSEAPAISRPCKIWSEKFARELHLLSSVERDLMLIALYHPGLVEIHEQRALTCLPCEHPLQRHPLTSGQSFPSLRGTVAVAEALGVLPFHPVFHVDDPDQPGQCITAPFPYVGDFLLFLSDAQGLYCINWTIKESAAQFERPLQVGRPARNPEKAMAKSRARHQIEEIYYADGAIPTLKLTGNLYNRDVAANLSQIFNWHSRKHHFSPETVREIVDHFQAGMVTEIPPIETLLAIVAAERYQPHDIKAVFYQAIWHRDLRPDLYQPILFDRPLRYETRDVLDEYSAWFKRG